MSDGIVLLLPAAVVAVVRLIETEVWQGGGPYGRKESICWEETYEAVVKRHFAMGKTGMG